MTTGPDSNYAESPDYPDRLRRDGLLWAEMLARVSRRNIQLRRRAGRRQGGGRAVIEALERERGRIARELHAGAGQPLAGIRLNLDLIEDSAHAGSTRMPSEARDALNRLHRLAEEALGQVRSLSHHLHPPAWQDLGLGTALRSLIEESGIRRKCETETDIGPLSPEPAHAVKVGLYRCAQEGVSNVLRHSGANRFGLRLRQAGSWIEMSISDNGRGFSAGDAPAGGIGLRAMREHAEALGGQIRIGSGGRGTTIKISVPFSED